MREYSDCTNGRLFHFKLRGESTRRPFPSFLNFRMINKKVYVKSEVNQEVVIGARM